MGLNPGCDLGHVSGPRGGFGWDPAGVPNG